MKCIIEIVHLNMKMGCPLYKVFFLLVNSIVQNESFTIRFTKNQNLNTPYLKSNTFLKLYYITLKYRGYEKIHTNFNCLFSFKSSCTN